MRSRQLLRSKQFSSLDGSIIITYLQANNMAGYLEPPSDFFSSLVKRKQENCQRFPLMFTFLEKNMQICIFYLTLIVNWFIIPVYTYYFNI